MFPEILLSSTLNASHLGLHKKLQILTYCVWMSMTRYCEYVECRYNCKEKKSKIKRRKNNDAILIWARFSCFRVFRIISNFSYNLHVQLIYLFDFRTSLWRHCVRVIELDGVRRDGGRGRGERINPIYEGIGWCCLLFEDRFWGLWVDWKGSFPLLEIGTQIRTRNQFRIPYFGF